MLAPIEVHQNKVRREIVRHNHAIAGESSMFDILMLAFGIGMFVCFLGYTALCDSM